MKINNMLIIEKIKDKQIFINAIYDFDDFNTIEESNKGFNLSVLKFNLEQQFNAKLEYNNLHTHKITLVGELN